MPVIVLRTLLSMFPMALQSLRSNITTANISKILWCPAARRLQGLKLGLCQHAQNKSSHILLTGRPADVKCDLELEFLTENPDFELKLA